MDRPFARVLRLFLLLAGAITLVMAPILFRDGVAGRLLLRELPATTALVILVYVLVAGLSLAIAIAQRRNDDLCQQERQQGEWLQAVLTGTGVGMGLCDPVTGAFRRVNGALTQLLGHRQPELIGRPWWQFCHPEDQGRARAMAEALLGGLAELPRQRLRFQRHDRQTIWAEVTLSCIAAPGQPAHLSDPWPATLIVQLADVSELVEQAAYLGAAAEAGIVGVWDWDVTRDVLTWDAVMFKLYGLRADQFRGAYEAWASAIHPDDRAATEAEIQAALKGWRPYEPHFRVVWPDGSIHHLQARSRTSFAADGTPLRMLGVNYDITEQVQREQEVEQQRRLLATTLDALVDPLLVLTLEARAFDWPQLRIAELNPAAASFFSRSAFQLVGRVLSQALPTDGNEALHRHLLDVARGGPPLLADEHPLQLQADAEPLYVDVRAVADGERVVLNFRDVTARRQAIRTLAESEERFRLLAMNSGDVVLWLAPDGCVRWVSPSLTASLGWLPDEWIGKQGTDFLVHHGDADHYQANLETLQRAGGAIVARDQVRAKDGRIHWVETHASPYLDTRGTVDGIVASFHLVDEMVVAEQQLRQSEQRHRRLADTIKDVVWAIDLDGHFTCISPSVKHLRGFSPEEVLAMDLCQNFTPASFAIVQAGLEQCRRDVQAGRPVAFEAELEERCKDGSTVWTDVKASALYDEQGMIQEIVGVTRDVSRQHQLGEALKISEARYRLLAENARDVIWTIEPDGRISSVSPSVKLLRGYTPEEAMVQTPEQIHPPESRERSSTYFQQLLKKARAGLPLEPFRDGLEYHCKDGSTIWAEVMALPVNDEHGRFRQLLGVSRDITERKHFEQQLLAANQQLERLATTDALTGVWNRRQLEATIGLAVQRADRYDESLSLILCDIDHFKRINDHYGHPVGDRVLQEFCARIGRHLRSSDSFGRWGGEEFLILLPQSPASAACVLAEKLRSGLCAVPFPWVGCVRASFGVAERQPGETAMAWLKRVDDGLYTAKDTGRNRVVQA